MKILEEKKHLCYDPNHLLNSAAGRASAHPCVNSITMTIADLDEWDKLAEKNCKRKLKDFFGYSFYLK